MGAGYLADTNVVIDLVLGKLPHANATWLDAQLANGRIAISIITRIELLGKVVPAAEAEFLQAFVQNVVVLPLDEPTTQQTIRLRQQHRVKLPDAIIAATALAHGIMLLSRNVGDFRNVGELAVVDLHGSIPSL